MRRLLLMLQLSYVEGPIQYCLNTKLRINCAGYGGKLPTLWLTSRCGRLQRDWSSSYRSNLSRRHAVFRLGQAQRSRLGVRAGWFWKGKRERAGQVVSRTAALNA